MTSDTEERTAPVIGLTSALLEFWVAALAIVVLTATLGWTFIAAQDEFYVARAEMVISDPSQQTVFGSATGINEQRRIRNEVARASSLMVMRRAAETLGELTAAELQTRVRVSSADDLDLIRVRAEGPTAESAARYANAVVEAYQQVVNEDVARSSQEILDELEPARNELRDRIAGIDTRLQNLRAAAEDQIRATLPVVDGVPPTPNFAEVERLFNANPEAAGLIAERGSALDQLEALDTRATQILVDSAIFGSGVDFVEPAEPPREPASPRPLTGAVVGMLLGLLASIPAAVLWARRPARADEPTDPARILHAPLLGPVPRWRTRALGICPALTDPSSGPAEAFQKVAAGLEFQTARNDARVLLVSSARQGDGKTVASYNLAAAVARAGTDVVLVDADMRSLTLTNHVNDSGQSASPFPGSTLTDIAAGDADVSEVLVRIRNGAKSLQFATIGDGGDDPVSFLRSHGFRDALKAVGADADMVIIDAPPLGELGDASAIAYHVDALLVVVRRRTPIDLLQDAARSISFIDKPVIGYVFNRARGSGPSYRHRRIFPSLSRRSDDGGDGRSWAIKSTGEPATTGSTGRKKASTTTRKASTKKIKNDKVAAKGKSGRSTPRSRRERARSRASSPRTSSSRGRR